jgi:hypothetical protein
MLISLVFQQDEILFFHLHRPKLGGWSTLTSQVALPYTATIMIALAAHSADRPDLIRSPKRVLANTWESFCVRKGPRFFHAREGSLDMDTCFL